MVRLLPNLAQKYTPGDKVYFKKKLLSAEKKVYLLLNKPKDYVTTMDDPHADKIVIDLVKRCLS